MRRSPRQVGLAAGALLALTMAMAVATAPVASADSPDLSSDQAINAYLVSIGVDPAEAVWQEGLKNYAGPSCPGLGWTCAPADAPIVQIAAPLGTNLFSCTGLDCVAVQIALGAGQNDAECDRGDKHADMATQVCDITQENTIGNNVAGINQSIEQKGSTVTARQVAHILQSGDGKNTAGFHQVILQSSQVTGTPQSQDAYQAATLEQVSGSGDNSSNIDQRQTQTQRASGSEIMQAQNTAGGTDLLLCDRPEETFDQAKNQCAEVSQESTDGNNSSNLSQLISERQTAGNAEDVDQVQGTFVFLTGGQAGTVDQLSTSPADSDAVQDMRQVQTAGIVTNSLSQSQDTGDPRCCQMQFTNPDNMADITQTTDQQASDPSADQQATLQGDCDSSGSCHLLQSSTIDGDDPVSFECGPGAIACHNILVNSDGGID
jgi:hypothetical protein